jgi:hypothetical protein
MSIHRQKNLFENQSHELPSGENEAFVMCPQVFLAKLTPDEYRAQLELYRRAYERALARIQGDSTPPDGAYSFDI